MQPDALGTFPYMVVLGFGIVWITFATLGLIWFTTWRSTRPARVGTSVATAAPLGRSMTRGRVLTLVAVGLLGGAVIGGAYASYAAGQSRPPRGVGTTGAPSP